MAVSLGVMGVFGSSAVAADDQAPQVVPLALERVFAPDNAKLDIDGRDDKRVDVDVAVLDSGVDLSHPDLNVVGGTDCTAGQAPSYSCSNASPDDGDDSHGHGTSSALRLAALDNGIGGVGAAAGARLWAVDIYDDATFGPGGASMNLEAIIAGIRWVVDHASTIEVAHMPLGCAPEQVGASPQPFCRLDGSPSLSALQAELDDAVADAIDAGVVLVDGAGNWNLNVNTAIPHRQDDDLIIVSGIADSDGLPGSLGADACGVDDDHSANTNWGTLVDVAAPGCATSAASPHVSAAAAILASRDNPSNRTDVRDIATTIAGDRNCAITSPDTTPNVGAGNCGWTDDSPDGVKEPLLDLGDDGVFDPVLLPGLGHSDAVGMFRPGDSFVGDEAWGLRTANWGGAPNYYFDYDWDGVGDVPLAGDWDGDGRDSIGMFHRASGFWSLSNQNAAGDPDLEFGYHWGAAWDVPIVGDWDGDGDDTIGMYRPGDGAWYLRNTNSSGATDVSFSRPLVSGDIPITGDWDGDGDDTIGAFRPSNGTWYLRNSNTSGLPDITFVFHWGAAWDVPIVGDWDGDGDDTIGMYRPGSGTWNLRNTNSSGAVDVEFTYYWGAPGDRPVTGDWDG